VKQAKGLREFYSRVEGSNIAFVNQPQPRGFGDAVLRAEPFTEEEFMVVGADTVIQGIPQIRANSFLITEVEDPRPYGVVTLEGDRVLEVEEKPVNPRSRKVIVPYYAFTREIFRALRDSPVHEELQLTEGIRLMLRRGIPFRAVEVREVYDLGNIEGYLDYLRRFSLH
jgi:UTP--glucose-1-phosphate uridylyltransferase